LQKLYECILESALDRRNFHKKIMSAGILISTGQKRVGEKKFVRQNCMSLIGNDTNELVQDGFSI